MIKLAADIETDDIIKFDVESVIVDNVTQLGSDIIVGGYFQDTGENFLCEYDEQEEIVVIGRLKNETI